MITYTGNVGSSNISPRSIGKSPLSVTTTCAGWRLVSKRTAKFDQLRMPDRKDHPLAAGGGGTGENSVRIHARQPFVDQMLVGIAAAERRGVVGHRVAVPRLDEHEADDWANHRGRRGPR